MTRGRIPRVLLGAAVAVLVIGCGKYGPPTRSDATPAAQGGVSAAGAEDCEDEPVASPHATEDPS